MSEAPTLLVRQPVDVVAIGASAGGLEACRRLLQALPTPNGMVFIFIQHLDPHHDSSLVELLAPHTGLVVLEAEDGMPLLADHLFVIRPGTSLSIKGGALQVSSPREKHGSRLPLDFMLTSLARELGPRAMAIVLSGNGFDGSKGAQAIRAEGGLVLVQDLVEAEFKGMPESVIAAGAASAVLPVADMPAALQAQSRGRGGINNDYLPRIIGLLKQQSGSNFALYKPGTLRRRVERRMGIAGLRDLGAYTAMLEADVQELALLGKDMLIHVTAFFRDSAVFTKLETDILPELIASHPEHRPIRVWVAGCSTGEETWSLAILFQEAIAASGKPLQLQVFASDLDADAVNTARRALYPATIATEVSAARLARFFVEENGSWRVAQDLRGCIIFSVQDVLADAPFSRLDFVSCRNLLIYLKPEAQTRVISLFHFALQPGGLLLLGNAETIGNAELGFEPLAKSERLWRRGRESRSVDLGSLNLPGEGARAMPRGARVTSRQMHLAELCRRLVLETHAPAAVLLDRHNNCLYSMGPVEHYLAHPDGQPTHDLLLMARPGIRTKLRRALQRARENPSPTIVSETTSAPAGSRLRIDARSVTTEPGEMLLVCFVELQGSRANAPAGTRTARVASLERELEETRTELSNAVRDLEILTEEQRSADEETLSVNEEYQSANEELLTSKEELQSLNEELTALNGQLQETLERSRTTTNDLQNVLYSTDVATLFLAANLQIRFFTPATRAVFSLRATDIGRPLSDLRSQAGDEDLLADVNAVLASQAAPAREIRTAAGVWFLRNVLPYRTQDGQVDGVVITFTDVTERKQTAQALEEARRVAVAASAAKSQFLSAASHDLRQPLQTLILLQAMLARTVQGGEAIRLVRMLEPTLTAMAGMLNTLLDSDQIGSGTLVASHASFRITPLLEKLREEFSYLTAEKGLELRVVPCTLAIETDPTLLELMLRNLMGNALKYTPSGRILLGCRRRGDMLAIEVWDTGIGIAPEDQELIFGEYQQIRRLPRARQGGLGLGLSIVQRLAVLLGHRLSVRSRLGQGSVFTVEAAIVAPPRAEPAAIAPLLPRQGRILVIEDDADLRGLLLRLLLTAGHDARGSGNGADAVAQAEDFAPQLVLADFNLPGELTGLQTATQLRAAVQGGLPIIILTGDISPETQQEIARLECVHLHKPVKPDDLLAVVQQLLPAPARPSPRTAASPTAVGSAAEAGCIVHVVDDDPQLRAALRTTLEMEKYRVEDHASAESFLAAHSSGSADRGCLLIDVNLPGMSGYELLTTLRERGDAMPAIMITGYSDVPAAVRSIKAGATDFIEKPVQAASLLAVIAAALEQSRDRGKLVAEQRAAVEALARLTERQRVVMERVLAGDPSKNIAADLGISQRTVEAHRAAIMRVTKTRSLPALARLAMQAAAEKPG